MNAILLSLAFTWCYMEVLCKWLTVETYVWKPKATETNYSELHVARNETGLGKFDSNHQKAIKASGHWSNVSTGFIGKMFNHHRNWSRPPEEYKIYQKILWNSSNVGQLQQMLKIYIRVRSCIKNKKYTLLDWVNYRQGDNALKGSHVISCNDMWCN